MCANEKGFMPLDAAITKQWTDAVWTYVQGSGVPETEWGTTANQEYYVIQFIGQSFSKNIDKIKPIRTMDDLQDFSYDHAVFGENNLLGWHENHWMARRMGSKWEDGGYMWVNDSALSLDLGSDHYTIQGVFEACQRLFGTGQILGWLWSWTD